MNRSELEKNVIACVARSMARSEADLTLDTKIMTDLGADSLDFMDIIFQLEGDLNIQLEKNDFDFLKRTGLSREEAVQNDILSDEAKKRLAPLLPGLNPADNLAPKDLAQFVSIESLVRVLAPRFAL
ncbi:MAG: acyl carrier protein [Bacteriovoracia bacterium]